MEGIKAEEIKKVPEGIHKGTVADVTRRTDPYDYVDLHIDVDEIDLTLRVGYPAKISEMSSLGKLLERFGVDIEVKKEYDPENIMKGLRVQFLTQNEKTANGTFARILPDSVKPVDP